MKSFFERAGIYGYSYPIERAMLASLVTGTPTLLIGKIGEAKTKAAETMAALLFDDPAMFQKIAADKAQFEDMVGFPNPQSLAEGKMKFVRSDITIWDKKFVLVDEISRCNPQMQNKFLELVLERQVLGIPTGVEWVWCTMNPLEYAGSQPLDGALAGRMGYVIEVPEVHRGTEEVIDRVAASKGHAQTPAFAYWGGDKYAPKKEFPWELRQELRTLLQEAFNITAGLDEHWSPVVAKYLRSWLKSLSTSGLNVDGRRLVMMRYNIISNIAIQTVQAGRSLEINEIKQLVKEVIPLSVPWLATASRETFQKDKFLAAHATAAPFLDKGDSLIYRIVTQRDPLEKTKLFIRNRTKIDSLTATSLVTSIYDQAHAQETAEEQLEADATLYALRLALPYLFLRLDSIPAEALGVTAKQYPINFYTKDKPSGDISVKNHAQAKQLAQLYEKLRLSKNQTDWAAAYWAFRAGPGKQFTFDEVITRFETVHRIIRQVADELREFIPQKVNNVSSAAAAITELFGLGSSQAEVQETNAPRSGSFGSAFESSGAPISI